MPCATHMPLAHNTLTDHACATFHAGSQVPKERVKIDHMFSAIEAKTKDIGIKDWGLSQTSLEEVFLQIVEATSAGEPVKGAYHA